MASTRSLPNQIVSPRSAHLGHVPDGSQNSPDAAAPNLGRIGGIGVNNKIEFGGPIRQHSWRGRLRSYRPPSQISNSHWAQEREIRFGIKFLIMG